MKRSEIAEKHKWDLSYIIKDEKELDRLIAEISDGTKKIKKYENKLATREGLLAFFNEDTELSLKLNRVYTYVTLQKVVDLTDAKWLKYANIADSLYSKYLEATAFVSPEICALDTGFLLGLAKDKDFADFDRILKNAVDQKPHILSKPEEVIMSRLSTFTDFDAVYKNLNDVELKYGKVVVDGKKQDVSHSKYQVLLRNKNQDVRTKTYNNMHKTYGAYNLTLSQNYINRLKYESFVSKQRNFKSSFQMACFNEEVDEQIFHSLIEVLAKYLPTYQDYLRAKKDRLKVKDFFLSDLYVNTTDAKEAHYEIEDMVSLVTKALAPLGKEYCDVVRMSIEKRWVDIFPNDNKESGAFETSCGVGVPYVMLNFEKNYNGVSTFAHEIGHALHSYYTEKCQPLAKQNYAIFVAEVASTVNELLLNHYMRNNAKTKEERLYYLEDLLTEFTGAVIYQSLYGEFEYIINQKIDQDKPVTFETLNKTFSKLLNKYYGKDVKKSKWAKFGWARIPHFYRPFYVYKYATSLLISILISHKILTEGPSFVPHYIEFLKGGASATPVELLKLCGIDATKKETYKQALDVFVSLVEEYKA